MKDKINIGVVGATGLVGKTALDVIRELEIPGIDLFPYATQRIQGRYIDHDGRRIEIKTIPTEPPPHLDYALFCAPNDVAAKIVPGWKTAGIRIIDNSSVFRMDKDVPLVVPEVNSDKILEADNLVANPNCSTIQLAVALEPLRKLFGLARIGVSTYQSVSGVGLNGIKRWQEEIEGFPETESPFGKTIHGNVVPFAGSASEDGYSSEEIKLMNELPKILGDSSFEISATVVRVPVEVGHSEAVEVDLNTEPGLDEVVDVLNRSEGIVFYGNGNFPTPLELSGKNEVFIGRVRKHPSRNNTFLLWIVADNLRKGAATNAVQIMQQWINKTT